MSNKTNNPNQGMVQPQQQQKIFTLNRNVMVQPQGYQKMNSADNMFVSQPIILGAGPTVQRNAMTRQGSQQVDSASQEYYQYMKEQQMLMYIQAQQQQQQQNAYFQTEQQAIVEGGMGQLFDRTNSQKQFIFEYDGRMANLQQNNFPPAVPISRSGIRSRGGQIFSQKSRGQLTRLEEENENQGDDDQQESYNRQRSHKNLQRQKQIQSRQRQQQYMQIKQIEVLEKVPTENIQYLTLDDRSPLKNVVNEEEEDQLGSFQNQEYLISNPKYHTIEDPTQLQYQASIDYDTYDPNNQGHMFQNEEEQFDTQEHHYQRMMKEGHQIVGKTNEYLYQEAHPSRHFHNEINSQTFDNQNGTNFHPQIYQINNGGMGQQQFNYRIIGGNQPKVIDPSKIKFAQSRNNGQGIQFLQEHQQETQQIPQLKVQENQSRMISSNNSFNNDLSSLGPGVHHDIQQQDYSQIIEERKSGQPNFQQSIIRDNDSLLEEASMEKHPNSSQLIRDNSVNGRGTIDGALSVKANENYSPSATQKNNLLSIKNESFKVPQGAAILKSQRSAPPANVPSKDEELLKQIPEIEWKYIEQPSLTRLQTLIYHVHKKIILDLDLNIPGRPGLIRQQLITQYQLDEFYQTKIKMFPSSGRELEIQEPYDNMFIDQADISECPEVDKRILANIRKSVDHEKVEMKSLQDGPPIYIKSARSPQLFFNSRFESGNLREVEQVTEVEYNLYLNFDFNTSNYTQWYFFSVRNIKKGFHYTFNIMNLQKEDSSYQQGMMPFVYSVKRNREKGTNEWLRTGENIEYFKGNLKVKQRQCAPDYYYDPESLPFNQYYNEAEPPLTHLSQLTFSFEFAYDEDIMFFSQFQPYTLSDLKDYLFTIPKKYPSEHLRNVLRIQNLCDTLEGNECHVLTISDNVNQEQQQLAGYNGANPKQVVFISSRVHPGESNSSFMVQGVIDFLLQQTKEAAYMREQFIFKIIPMLNPDGVVRGNYRSDMLGVDLNRRWNKPSKVLHPTIYYSKQILKSYMDNQVIVFCDMHGHSRKRNVFMYGCQTPPTDINNHKNNNLIRMIPYMLGQRSKFFQFNDCKFANEKEKESTARLVMFTEFNILNSYTLEATFYAPYDKDRFKKKVNLNEDDHIKSEDLVQVGQDMIMTMYLIMQSKIMRRKFLQLEGPGGQILTQPIIGGGVGSKPVKDEKPVEKPKIVIEASPVPVNNTNQEIQEMNRTISNIKPPLPQQQQQQQNLTYLANPTTLNNNVQNSAGAANQASAFYCAQHQMQFPFGQKQQQQQNMVFLQGQNNPIKMGATTIGTTSTATFLHHQSSAHLINAGYATSFGFSPDYSHYGTSEFQRQPPMQTQINGISLKKRSPRTHSLDNNGENEEAYQSVVLPQNIQHNSTPQKPNIKLFSQTFGNSPLMSESTADILRQHLMINSPQQLQIFPSTTLNAQVFPQQQQKNFVKMKPPIIKIIGGISGNATLNGPLIYQTSPVTMVQNSPPKYQLKQNLMKQSIIENQQQQHQQYNSSIFPDQPVKVSKGVQQKNNPPLDIFKMYHNNKFGMTRNIRGLINQNIIQTSGSNNNSSPSMMAATMYNQSQNQIKKRSSGVHISASNPPHGKTYNYSSSAMMTGDPNQTMKNGGNVTIYQTNTGYSPNKAGGQQQNSHRERDTINQQNLPLTSLFGGPLQRGTSNTPTLLSGVVPHSNQDVYGQNYSQVVSVQVPHDIERLPQIIQKQFLKGPTT